MNKCSEVTAHTGADSLEIPIASMLPVLAGFEADPDILWMLQSSPFCLCLCVGACACARSYSHVHMVQPNTTILCEAKSQQRDLVRS